MMENNDDIYPENTKRNDHPIIILNENIQENLNETQEDASTYEKKKLNFPSLLYHFSTSLLAVTIYTLCVLGSGIPFTEIIDLEIPLIILLSLILAESSIHGYSKITYVLYAIISCVLYFISPNYTFFFVIALTSSIVIKLIELIYTNKYDFNNKEFKTQNILYEHVHRVRYHLLLSFILFIVFLLLGYFFAGTFQPIVNPSVQGLQEGVQQGTISLETIYLFKNNFSVASNIILGGLYFSTVTTYLLVFNALVVGYSGCTMNIIYFLAYTLPHGILELTGIIIAGAAGFRLTHAILTLLNGIKLNKKNRSEIFTNKTEICCKMFIDVLIMVIIVAILLFIAAYIEANLTIPIGKQIMEWIY